MSFLLDVNLQQRQWCLSHLALEVSLTLGWIHSKFIRQWSPKAVYCINHLFHADFKYLDMFREAPCNGKK